MSRSDTTSSSRVFGPGVDGTRIMVIDDSPAVLAELGDWLRASGYEVHTFTHGGTALAALGAVRPVVVLVDVVMPKIDGLELLRLLRSVQPSLPVVMMTAQDSVSSAVECMRLGAFDYMVKPIDRTRLLTNVEKAIRQYELEHRVLRLEQRVGPSTPRFEHMVGTSAAMRRVYEQVERVRDSTISVCIMGETGTGKELIARAIAQTGRRAQGPFVSVNCGAIPDGLQESELFGHEKGSFTGAQALRRGRFEMADQGTLFLDEVGEVSLSVQVKLLRVLQERKVERVGGSRPIDVDVRVVSATHRDLKRMVRETTFREDLYFRLVGFPIYVPALRERSEDIPLLVAHFLRKYAEDIDHPVRSIRPEAMDAFCVYRWPGNVRELENVVHRSMLVCERDSIGLECLPPHIRDGWRSELTPPPRRVDALTLADLAPNRAEPPANEPPAALDAPRARDAAPLAPPDAKPGSGDSSIAAAEKKAIEEALAHVGGNLSNAAKRLGIGRSTLYRKLARHGIDPKQYNPTG